MLHCVGCSFGVAPKHGSASTRPYRYSLETLLAVQHATLRFMLSDSSTDRALPFASGANLPFRCGSHQRLFRDEVFAVHTKHRSGQVTCSAISATPCEGSKLALLAELVVLAIPE